MKNIIIIRGPLGVGKSTISRLLGEELNAKYISLDQILEENDLEGEDGIPVENFLKANKIIFDMVEESEHSFIIDGCFYYQEQVDDIVAHFGESLIVFSLICDVETCISRDAGRDRIYGEDAARFVHMMTSNVKVGHEMMTDNLSAEETVEEILRILKSENS